MVDDIMSGVEMAKRPLEKNSIESLLKDITNLCGERESINAEREKNIAEQFAKLEEFSESLKKQREEIDSEIAAKNEALEMEARKRSESLDERERLVERREQEIRQREIELHDYESTINDRLMQLLDKTKVDQELRMRQETLSRDEEAFSMVKTSTELGADSELIQRLQKENEELKKQVLNKEAESLEPPIVQEAKSTSEPVAELPEYVLTFEKAITDKWSKAYRLDADDECLCMAVKDCEIRFFFTQPRSVKILTNKKNVKHTKSSVVQLNRVSADWELDFQDNFFIATMAYPATLSAELIVTKCDEAIKNYF